MFFHRGLIVLQYIAIVNITRFRITKSQNLTRLDNHGALWHRMGNLKTTTSYAHLHIPINTADLKQRQQFMEAINARFQILQIPEEWPADQKRLAKTRLRDLKLFVRQTTSDTVERIAEAIAAAHQPTKESNRKKRQLILAGLAVGAVLAGVVAEGFTHSTIDDVIKGSQQVLSHTVEQDLIHIHNNEDDIRRLNRTIAILVEDFGETFTQSKRTKYETAILRASFATLINAIDVARKTRAVLVAREGSLDPENFNRAKLVGALEELNTKTVRKGFEIQTTDTEELKSLPTSYVVDPKTETIHIITHIPLFRPGNQMSLFRYIDAPIILPTNNSTVIDQHQPLHLEFNPARQYLAVMKDGTTYIEMTEHDLNSCLRKRDNFFCPLLGKYKKQRRSCLMALYGNDPKEIMRDCSLMVSRPESQVERIDKNQWLLTEPQLTEIKIQCDNGFKRREEIQGNYLIALTAGCEVNTDNINIIQPKYEADVVIEGIMENPVSTPSIWIDEGEEIHFVNITKQMLAQVGTKAPLSSIKTLMHFRKEMQEVKKESVQFQWPKWTMNSLLPSATTILSLTLLIILAKWVIPTIIQRCRLSPTTDDSARFSTNENDAVNIRLTSKSTQTRNHRQHHCRIPEEECPANFLSDNN